MPGLLKYLKFNLKYLKCRKAFCKGCIKCEVSQSVQNIGQGCHKLSRLQTLRILVARRLFGVLGQSQWKYHNCDQGWFIFWEQTCHSSDFRWKAVRMSWLREESTSTTVIQTLNSNNKHAITITNIQQQKQTFHNNNKLWRAITNISFMVSGFNVCDKCHEEFYAPKVIQAHFVVQHRFIF